MEEELNKIMRDDSFVQWIKDGKPPGNHWHTRYSSDDDYRALVDQAETLIKSFVIRGEKIDAKTIERIKSSIDHQIDFMALYNSAHTGRANVYYRWAAIVIFFVVTAFVIRFFSDDIVGKDKLAVSQVVKSTAKGQKQITYLPDGSKVKLNSNSKIQYDSYFNDTSRRIILSGEAFFEVEKDPTRPFVVVAGDVVTEALGTSFNINAAHGKTVDVTLATGKVIVMATKDSLKRQPVYLNPGEQLEFDAEKNTTNVHKAELDEILAWTNGKIIFKEADRNTVFEKLSNWYGVNFRFENNVLKSHWLYTGEFDNESLFNVLTSIGNVKNFSFQIEKDTVYIFQND